MTSSPRYRTVLLISSQHSFWPQETADELTHRNVRLKLRPGKKPSVVHGLFIELYGLDMHLHEAAFVGQVFVIEEPLISMDATTKKSDQLLVLHLGNLNNFIPKFICSLSRTLTEPFGSNFFVIFQNSPLYYH
jgi:hypothetical protein